MEIDYLTEALTSGQADTPILTVVGDLEVEEHTPHTHAHGQLIGCIRGVLSIRTERATWVIPARHGVWVPPLHPHSGWSQGVFTGWGLYVDPDHCSLLPDQPSIVEPSPLLWEAALRSAGWQAGPLTDRQRRLADVILDELHALQPRPLGLPLPQDDRLRQITGALLADPTDRRTLDDWAARIGTSPRTLSRRFVSETSLSFTEWSQRARLMRSLQMLADGASVTTTAIDCGYTSISAFIALFRRHFGVTPSHYAPTCAPALADAQRKADSGR